MPKEQGVQDHTSAPQEAHGRGQGRRRRRERRTRGVPCHKDRGSSLRKRIALEASSSGESNLDEVGIEAASFEGAYTENFNQRRSPMPELLVQILRSRPLRGLSRQG